MLGPVYRAQDREHLVAIKAFKLDVPPESAVDMGDALRALVAAAPRVDGLVTPVGAGVEGETPWLAMPHVALPTLDTRLRDEGAPQIDRALRILRALAEAIDTAHAQDLFHGSLHPRDVFVDAEGRVQITGFGVAHALMTVGIKPPIRRPYTAPELIADAGSAVVLSAEADHFSLGAMAFELLTGHRLMAMGADLASRLYRADGTGVDVAATALSAMLAARPEHRPSRAVAFARSLSQAFHAGDDGGGAPDRDRDGTAARGEPRHTVDEGASEEALQLFAKQGTLWAPPRTESLREPWRADAEDPPTLVYVEAKESVQALFTAEAEDRDQVDEDRDEVDEPATTSPSDAFRPPEVSEPPQTIPPSPAPAATAREMAVDWPMAPPPPPPPEPAPAPVDQEGATGSPPAVVLVLVLALGLAVGGAGGYLLGQRSGMRAALRAQGGETALTEEPGVAELIPDAPATAPPAEAPSPPGDQPAPAPVRERPTPVDGQIVVRSTPTRAGVIVNGGWRGRTPLTVPRLSLGTHTVRIVQDGYEAETRRVSLDARVPSATVSVQLERLAPSRRQAPTAAPRPGVTTGGLFLESRPTSARVFVDGHLVGTTPLVVAELAPGTHNVRLEHPGRRPWTTTVRIAAGQRTRVAASLEEGS